MFKAGGLDIQQTHYTKMDEWEAQDRSDFDKCLENLGKKMELLEEGVGEDYVKTFKGKLEGLLGSYEAGKVTHKTQPSWKGGEINVGKLTKSGVA